MIRILQEIFQLFQIRIKLKFFIFQKVGICEILLFKSNFTANLLSFSDLNNSNSEPQDIRGHYQLADNCKKMSALSGWFSFNIRNKFIHQIRLLNDWFWFLVTVLKWRHLTNSFNGQSTKTVHFSYPRPKNTCSWLEVAVCKCNTCTNVSHGTQMELIVLKRSNADRQIQSKFCKVFGNTWGSKGGQNVESWFYQSFMSLWILASYIFASSP